jgi:translocation and assembly module TamA
VNHRSAFSLALLRRGGLILAGYLLLVIWTLPVQAKNISYQVEGISGDLKENVEIHLSALPSIKAGRIEYRRPQIQSAVTKGLQALGYYQAKITLAEDERNPVLVHVQVDQGEPVKIRTLRVQLSGDALNDPVFDRLLKKLPLKKGDVLNHGKYESIKTALTNHAANRGYFDAELVQSLVSVYPEERAADVIIEFSSGHRYRFGEARIVGVTESLRLIHPLLTFKAGDPYQAQDLATLSQSLSETRYFRQVDVRPLLKEAKDHQVPIYIGLEPKSNNLVETGVGFSTDEGPRVQLNWEKPWLNSYGHSLTAQFKVSQPQQDLKFNYRIPGKDPINDYYNLQTGFERTDLNDTQSSKTSAGIHYWTKKLGNWERDYFTRLEYESFRQGLSEGNSLLLIPGVSLNRLRMDKSIDPEFGDRVILSAEFSQPAWGSDLGFTRLWARTKWLTTPWDGARFSARFEQGGIIGSNIDAMPPSLRFFAGGDQSVRGFGYETISPLDSSGQLTGARYVTTGSLEYAHPVAEQWRLATFVDAGTATNDYQDPVKVGTGFGVRWLSPFGPIRFDLAFGVSETQIPWRLHFGLGAEL